MSNFKHGHKRVKQASPEYNAWGNMKKRCFDRNSSDFKNYGGRGITVCDEWRDSFDAFLAGVGKRPSPQHTLDRIDNDKGYEPGNVRWATRAIQGANRRNVKIVWVDELFYTLPELAELFGINYFTLRMRFKSGWPIHRILGVDAVATPQGEC